MSFRLIAVLLDRWESMDGYAVAHNMPDLRDIEFGRLCNYVYWRLTDGGDADGIEKFRARLWQPPPGVVADKRSPWSVENEMSSFSNVRARLGLSKPGKADKATARV